MSDLIKAITSLPSDMTVISLPAAPLLELVCAAARRQLTAVWLSLASVLLVQLDPPPLFPTTLTSPPDETAKQLVATLLPVLLETCLSALGQPDAMPNASSRFPLPYSRSDVPFQHPDIVQAFFGGMEKVRVESHTTIILSHLIIRLRNTSLLCSTSYREEHWML
jgi:hypothetical protein